jgi:4-alpha-glucanotransferase
MTDPQRWGIDRGYRDAADVWRDAPAATVDAFLTAMGADGAEGAEGRGPPPGRVVTTGPGRAPLNIGAADLELEDGTTVVVEGVLPPDLPFGYHRLTPRQGGEVRRVIVSPLRCRPPDRRTWGWAAQLYAARSQASWGIGDLADLRHLAHWSAGLGAGMVLVNPLHAALPAKEQQPSPYFASSRCFRNPLYLRIEELPGAAQLVELDDLAAAGRALNGDRRIDRDAVWQLKSAALEALFGAFTGDPDFDRFCDEHGPFLRGYATFCALGERHGFDWGNWPAEVRRPEALGVARFAESGEGARRLRYHSWVQWLLDRQVAAAAAPVGLVQDLAIGVDAGGADAWLWQDTFALGVRVGAPPDEFNTLGQDWGMPPFDPWRLRTAGYEPYIQTVRSGLRYAGGLRFDHVMGLFRLFWIPEGGSPAEGTYVRYPWSDLLDILALESHRAGAYVVGEDLGTVEQWVREELEQRGVLSYRLMWFESRPPDSGTWPEQALAAVTTHDLPTIAGLWSGADLAAQRSLGLAPNVAAMTAIREKVAGWIGAVEATPVAEVIEQTYRLLGQAPCALLSATLDDALAVEERPNMPGTVDGWPNWSIALPEPLERVETAPLALRLASALTGRGDGPSGSTSEAGSPDPATGPGHPAPGPDTGTAETG